MGVSMYTGDDFNYPDLIKGDAHGYSHALLGIFDPIASVATHALNALGQGDDVAYYNAFDPTVSLSRHIFQRPTRFYKTGVVFLAYLTGHQNHLVIPPLKMGGLPLHDGCWAGKCALHAIFGANC